MFYLSTERGFYFLGMCTSFERTYFLLKTIFFVSNATTCPCGLRGPPSWAWQQCNATSEVWTPITRSYDDVSGDIGGLSARRALKPKFY